MRYAGLVLAMAGCGSVFDVTYVDDQTGMDADVVGDGGGLNGEQPAFCDAPTIFNAFDPEMQPCAGAARYGEQLFAQHDGVLDINHTGTVALNAGCTVFSPYPFTANGVFLRVIEPLRITTGWTLLQVRNALQTTPELQAAIAFDGNSGGLYFNVDSTERARRDDVPQWWRIRAVDSMRIEALVSNDGVAWESWHVANVAVPDSINVDYSAGIYGTPGIAGTATLSAFGLCN